MKQTEIINRLLSIEAQAEVLKRESYRLRKDLTDVSTTVTPKRSKKGLTQEQVIDLKAKFRKKINRVA